jgi:hypothetical protein
MRAANPRTTSGRMKDFILYCVIGISIVTIIGLYAFHEGKLGHTSGMPVKWLGFGIMTAFVFGNTIRYSGRLWHLPKFWFLLGLFSVAHFALGLVILSRISKIGLIHFAAITPLEYFALTAYLAHFLNRPNKTERVEQR